MNFCPPFWLEEPATLIRDAHDFFPFHAGAQRCTTTALNSFTRFGLYLGILLAILKRQPLYILLSLGIAVVGVAAYYGMKNRGSINEGFVAGNLSAGGIPSGPSVQFRMPGTPERAIEVAGRPVEDVIGKTERYEPTGANPFMNLLLTEIGDNPSRPPAKNGEFMKRQFSNEFSERLYGDPTDVFHKNQNQRTWVVNPSTSIPNDRESLQNWLYRVPGRTCKEGNSKACTVKTGGNEMTWRG
jgi:hypothetical protein